jgi:hypothetical protein
MTLRFRFTALAVAALGIHAAVPAAAQQAQQEATQKAFCPTFGWAEGLGSNFQQPNSPFPVNDTKPNPNDPKAPIPDCNFHMWSFEAFVWATTLNKQNVPRFMNLPTEEDLLSPLQLLAGTEHPRTLQLAARSIVGHGLPGYSEGAGAFVQADGNVLVAPNGYPVYTSVHMNPTYFATARKNLIATGDYQKGQPNDTFPLGSAVFKATWLRLAPGETPPAGAFVTQAQVPVLTVQRSATSITILPVPNQFVTAKVALVGLHVVGVTVNHPEFLWGTFEHTLNTPQVPDNTFSTSGSSSTGFTFYKANTSYAQVNTKALPPQLTFNTVTQRFSPVTNAVLENQTGGENQTNGPANVQSVTTQGQSFLAHEKGDKKVQPTQWIFSNYYLVGTVWMDPNSYNLNSDQTNAVGSVNLANTTAETFQQFPSNADMSKVKNCFMCHNASSYSYQSSPPPLNNRLVAISHTLSVGTDYAVPNMVSGDVKMLFFKGQ